MAPSFELFDHTADVGIRVRAASMPELIPPAGEGLYAAIGELLPAGEGRDERWEFAGDDAAVLLRDYLTRLLVLFEREQRVVVETRVEAFTAKALRVWATSRAVDPEESEFYREVKAITYHGLRISPVAGGFEAEVIVDI